MKLEDEITEALILGDAELFQKLLPKFISNYKIEGGVNAKLSGGQFANYTLATCVAQFAHNSAHLEIIKILASYQADLTIPDGNGHTPIYKASIWGRQLAVKLLIEYFNVPFDSLQAHGDMVWPTPLIAALIHIKDNNNEQLKIELRKILAYLLSKGANIYKTIYEDMTLIGFLVTIGDLNILIDLDILCSHLGKPLDIYYSSLEWGHNLYTIAAFNRHWAIVSWLLRTHHFNPMAIPTRGKFSNIPSFITIVEFANFSCDEYFKFLVLNILNNKEFINTTLNTAYFMNDISTLQYNMDNIPFIKFLSDYTRTKFNIDFIKFIDYLKMERTNDSSNNNLYYSILLKYVLLLIGDNEYDAAIKHISKFLSNDDKLNTRKAKYNFCNTLLILLNDNEHYSINHNQALLKQIVSILENGLRKYGTLQDLIFIYIKKNSAIDLSLSYRISISMTLLNSFITLLQDKQLTNTESYKSLSARFFGHRENSRKTPQNNDTTLIEKENKKTCLKK